MSARPLSALAVLCAALAFPVSACKRGGGTPCPTSPPPIGLTYDDGTPAGELSVAADADGLYVAFRPAAGGPFAGGYLIGTPDGTFPYPAEASGGVRQAIPWDGLADDACGRTFTVAVDSLPTQAVTVTVTCASGAPIEAAIGTGGGTSGGPNCPM